LKFSRSSLTKTSSGGKTESTKSNGAKAKSKTQREFSYGQPFWKLLSASELQEPSMRTASLGEVDGSLISRMIQMRKTRMTLMMRIEITHLI